MNTEQLLENNIERLPPQSIESEQAVLGSLLVSGDGITRIVDLLQPEYFYRKAHQDIYGAMLDLFDNNEPIDILTISQYLQDKGNLESVGGRQYVTDLSLSVATTANLEYYARIVQEKALLRSLIKAGTEIVGNCYEQVDASEALDKAEHMIFGLAQKRSMQQLVHIKNVVEHSFQRIEERYENRENLSGVPSGFYDLDALTSGFQSSDLIIVAARPSMGKCLAHDSEIVLSDGSIATIESIYKGQKADLLTLKNDFKLATTQPSAYIDDGIKPVYKVKTRLGRCVETTLSHPFLTLSGWKKLAEIGIGTKIAVPRLIPVFGTKAMRECEIKLLAYFIGDGCLSNNKASFTNTNPVIQNDFIDAVSSFGGVDTRIDSVNHDRAASFSVRGDAGFIRGERIAFGNKLRLAIKNKYKNAQLFAKAAGFSKASITLWQQGKCVPESIRFEKICSTLQISSNELIPFPITTISRSSKNPVVLWLDKLNLWGKTAHTKTVPAEIFQLEKSQVALFINRLFATDGWATVYKSGQAQIGYATVSHKLATQLQHLLLRFGIIAKLRLRKVKYKQEEKSCYQIEITDRDALLKFIDSINIFGKEEAINKVKNSLHQKRKQTNCDLIPLEIWQQLLEKKGTESWVSLARRSNFQDTSNIHVNKRSLSRHRLLSLATSLNDEELCDLATSDIYWDEIVSIESMGDKQVYDLTIPETHNFIANDICVHNTALCLNLAQYAAVEKKTPVAIFSLEMSKEQLVQRMLCSEAGIDANRLRTGHLHTNDWTHLAMAMGKLGEAPIYIDDSALLNVLEIRAKARRLKAEAKGLGLIIVDYIQLLQGRKQSDNRVQEVSEISRSLKTLAREIDVPVIALSQLSRAVEARQNKRPMLSDLRESGSIEQDADIVMFIYRDEYYNPESEKRGEAEIIIAKQRNGPTGTVDLLYQSSITRFLNKVHNQYTA